MQTDRRSVLLGAVGLGLGAVIPRGIVRAQRSAVHERGSGEPSLRVITYNIHAFGPVAATDEGKAMARRVSMVDALAAELLLYEPDLVCLQEAASEARIAEVAERMEMSYVYFPGGARNDDGSVHPMFNGAILTRLPILESEDCPSASARADRKATFSRHLGRVLLDTGDERFGDGGRVAVIGCHMLPAWENTNHIRAAEIRAVGEAIGGDAGRSVLVLGDMNHSPDMPEYAGWAEIGLTDCFEKAGVGRRETWDAMELTRTIDYVFARGPVLEMLTRCRTLAEGRFRVHVGGEESAGDWALSDHMPVLGEFG